MSFRHLLLVTHRWFGLAAAAVLSIVGLTGAILVWPADTRVHRIASPLHDALMIGRVGTRIVDVSTMMAVVLVSSGLFLWWRRKIVVVHTRSGWRGLMFDLHHCLGILGFVIMLVLSLTGVGMATVTGDYPNLRGVVAELHTARNFPFVIQLFYALGSITFAVQGATGIVMWWKLGRPTPRREVVVEDCSIST